MRIYTYYIDNIYMLCVLLKYIVLFKTLVCMTEHFLCYKKYARFTNTL